MACMGRAGGGSHGVIWPLSRAACNCKQCSAWVAVIVTAGSRCAAVLAQPGCFNCCGKLPALLLPVLRCDKRFACEVLRVHRVRANGLNVSVV